MLIPLEAKVGLTSNQAVNSSLGSQRLTSLVPGPALVLQWTLPWPYNTPNMALYILAIFLHSMQQKCDQGTLGRQRLTLIGSRTHLGPSMDPAMALQYIKHGPLYIGSIFAFYAPKMGSPDSGDTKAHPHWVKDPPWSFNGPGHGPTIHQTWPFIYWLYICILCNKNGIKGLWGHKGPPLLGLGSALVLQCSLPWSYNTHDMVLYI